MVKSPHPSHERIPVWYVAPHYRGVVNSTHASTFSSDCQTRNTLVVIKIIVFNFIITI